MAANTYPKNHRQDKQLIVEGKNDLLVIAEFMEQAGVLWLTNNPPVHIVDSSGKPNLPTHTKGILKSDLWENLGIVVDADHDPQAAWQSSRNLCAVFFPDIPQRIPDEGCWIGENNGKKLGIWIMPGNKREGMLEDFLVDCMIHPDNSQRLWDFAKSSTTDARDHHGATYSENHSSKARVHCWLAWQEEPGNQLHQQIKGKRFNPEHGSGPQFVKWFQELFNPEMNPQV